MNIKKFNELVLKFVHLARKYILLYILFIKHDVLLLFGFRVLEPQNNMNFCFSITVIWLYWAKPCPQIDNKTTDYTYQRTNTVISTVSNASSNVFAWLDELNARKFELA